MRNKAFESNRLGLPLAQKRHRVWLGVLTAVAVALAACTAATPEATPSEKSGQIVIANAEPPTAAYWDPAASFGLVDDQVASLVYDTLLAMGPDGSLSPNLATEWDRVSDTELKLTIREGVEFHDGSPLTVDDVVASIGRILDPESTLAKTFMITSGSVSAEGNVVTVITNMPFGSLENSLANIAILSSDDIENPDNFSKTANGTGPFKFVSYVGDDITLEANEGYWGGAPEIGTVILRYIADPDARYSALLAGQVDIATRVGPNYVSQVASNDGFYVETVSPPSILAIISQHNGPLADKRIREAIAYAVDREAIAANIWQGVNAVSFNALPTTLESYVPSDTPFLYDPEKAKELLAEAGVAEGLTLTMATTTLFPNQLEVDQAVVGYLQAVGINVEVTQLEVGEFRTTYNTYDLSMNTIASFNNDPGFILAHFQGGVGAAIFNLVDPMVDELVATQNATLGDARNAAIDEAASYLWENQITLFLTDETWSTIVNKRVVGYLRAPLVGEPLLKGATLADSANG